MNTHAILQFLGEDPVFIRRDSLLAIPNTAGGAPGDNLTTEAGGTPQTTLSARTHPDPFEGFMAVGKQDVSVRSRLEYSQLVMECQNRRSPSRTKAVCLASCSRARRGAG